MKKNMRDFQIYFGERPVTVPITDFKRVSLGYNMLHAMADKNINIRIDGQESVIDMNQLHVIYVSGAEVEIEPDAEWFGTDEDNRRIKNTACEKILEEAVLNGEDVDPVTFAELQDSYTIGFHDEDCNTVWFAPFVWDDVKAAEMQNFMRYGIADNVTFSMADDSGKKIVIMPNVMNIMSPDGCIYMNAYNNRWAEELSL